MANIKINEMSLNISKLEKQKLSYEKAYKVMKDYDYDFVEDVMYSQSIFTNPSMFSTSTSTST